MCSEFSDLLEPDSHKLYLQKINFKKRIYKKSESIKSLNSEHIKIFYGFRISLNYLLLKPLFVSIKTLNSEHLVFVLW